MPPDEDAAPLSPEDRLLMEAASRSIKEATRIMGAWRDHRSSVETLLAVQDRLVKRVTQAEAATKRPRKEPVDD